MAHWEIIGTLIYKITERATPEELERAGMGPNYTQHGKALYPNDAAEQKARTAYENLIDLTDDRGVIETLSFLREREVVHFQRFGETLRLVQEHMEHMKHMGHHK